jgi:hypothetical protein
MKTDIELQKMMAEELPEYITIDEDMFWWKVGMTSHPAYARVTDREWLWIVAECEKELMAAQVDRYIEDLIVLTNAKTSAHLLASTWQQRATAYFRTIGKMA